jgi:hypothetical protein
MQPTWNPHETYETYETTHETHMKPTWNPHETHMKPMKLGNGMDNPCQQHTTCGTTLPATPRIYPSKRVRKCPNRPRIKGDTANFDEFCEISYNSFSFGPKIMFLDSFELSRVGLS